MIHQSVMEEEEVFKNKEHEPKEMEIEIEGRFITIEITEYGLEITRFVSTNPMDYLNCAFEPHLLS